MTISIRYFVVSNGNLKKVSQKKFNGFYFKKEATLPEYSSQTIKMAEVCVEVIDRTVTRVIRIDCERYKVDGDGALNKEHLRESNIHMINLMSPPLAEQNSTVIDATKVFEAKKLEHKLTWELTTEIIEKIVRALKL